MPYLETAQQWLTQSALLLQAKPSTTRITTKYTIKPPADPSNPSKDERKAKTASSEVSTPTPVPAAASTVQPQEPIRATLTLKTYDPASGTTLKYSTTKAAEVSRLIQILGRLGRGMAGLPEVKEDVVMGEDKGEGGAATPVVENVPAGGKTGGQGGAGGKKGKKKGKK